MKFKKNVVLAAMLPAGLVFAQNSLAYDVVPAGQPVVTGEPSRVGAPWNHRSTFNIPGTNTDVAFGGYIKLDALYDLDYDQGIVTDPFSVTNEDNKTSGSTTFTAAESRLNFRTQTHTDQGTISTYVEGHFVPDESFNLRHAYGEFGGFLAGKTWSNFMQMVGSPRTLKLGNPIGYTFERQPQVRYTRRGDSGFFAVALEDSSTSVVSSAGIPVASESPLPDLTLRYQYGHSFGISGIVRELATNEYQAAIDDSTLGYGIAARAVLPLGDRLVLKGNTMLGSGLGNYLNVIPEAAEAMRTPDAVIVGNSLESVDFQSYGASLEYRWAQDWSSAIGTSYLTQDLPENVAGLQGFVDNMQFSYANLIWDVNERLAVGAEFQYTELERLNGESLDASRIQASALFQF